MAMRQGSWRGAWLGGGAALALMLAAAPAAAQTPVRTYAIGAQDLAGALRAFALESGKDVVFDPALLRGKTTDGASGELSETAALTRILGRSGLGFRRTASGGFVVEKAGPQSTTAAGDISPAADTSVDQVVVTGTRIVGASVASPVTAITDTDIRVAGFVDLGELARSLPMNYSGGQNPGVRFGVGSISNQNVSGASSFNLRGLGPDATLTLLNGHRLAYNGNAQSVDISIIPIDAVSSVQIVPDGASAVYGSDAVAGVANIVLKRDFEGLSTSARWGTATSGGGDQQTYELVTGARWSSGGVLLGAKFDQQDQIETRQRSYTRQLTAPNFLTDFHRQASLIGSVHQDLGERIQFAVDASYSDRFVKSAQQSTVLMAYRYRNRNISRAIAPSLKIDLPKAWALDFSGFAGADNTTSYSISARQATGVGSTSATTYRNAAYGVEAGAQGPVFRLPGGDVRLAVGGGYRSNDFTQRYSAGTWAGDQSARFVYGEVFAPLVSSENARPLVHELSLTGALRNERYGAFGAVTTPKVGVVYGPTDDLVLKASWGRSFKAPTLLQMNREIIAQILDLSLMGVAGPPGSTFFSTVGGDPALGPEKAETFSATAEYRPSVVPGLRLGLTWYQVDYRDRVVAPLQPFLAALIDPAFAPYIDYNPTLAKLNALIATAPRGLLNFATVPYDPNKVYAIGLNTYINAARQKIRGVDLTANYGLEAFGGDLDLSGQASWLDIKQRNGSGSAAVELTGAVYNPPGFRGRLGAVWRTDAVTLTAAYNYIGKVADNRTVPAIDGDQMQTVDAGVTYRVGAWGRGLKGTEVSIFVQNLLNEDPPILAYAPLTSVPYDHSNYSPVGRFVSVQLRRVW